MYKLINKGIGGKYVDILRGMYSNARSRVKWNSQLGRIFENIQGVLQGGVISPTLFKIFLDDLKDYLDKNKGITIDDVLICYILFADDLILVSETATGLQKLIDGVAEFCKQWHMIINLMKTKITIFNPRFVLPSDPNLFHFNGDTIQQDTNYNYVGINFSNHTQRFELNTQSRYDKTTRATFAAKKLIYDTIGYNASPSLLFKTFDAQILPIMEYGCEIFYPGKPICKFETLHPNKHLNNGADKLKMH